MAAIAKADIKLKERLGTGGFGTVYRGLWRTENIPVAIKKLMVPNFQEIQILTPLRHPNIVTLFGFVQEETDLIIVLELCELGSLRSFLEQRNIPLALPLIYDWMLQASYPIDYLRNNKIEHMDIKTDNYVINSQMVLKLTDFGLSQPLEKTKSHSSEIGSWRWMPPERFNDHKLSPKFHIYSLALVFWCLFTRKLPFADKTQYSIVTAVCNGIRPSLPLNCPKPIADLIEVCWNGDRSKRPDIKDVIMTLVLRKSAFATTLREVPTPSGFTNPLSRRHVEIKGNGKELQDTSGHNVVIAGHEEFECSDPGFHKQSWVTCSHEDFDDSESEADEEDADASIIVSNHAGISEEMLTMYFENKRRSGGGDIVAIDVDPEREEIITIRFRDSKDAQGVLNQRSHKLSGYNLVVLPAKKKKPRPTLPIDQRCLFLEGIAQDVNNELLLLHLENCTKIEDTPTIVYGEKPGTALVTYPDEIENLEDVITKIQKKKLKGQKVSASCVHVPDCILVTDLKPDISEDNIKLYFENERRSGGGFVREVKLNNEENQAIVYFEDYQVVNRVVERKHTLSETSVTVSKYLECLSSETSSEGPTSRIPKEFSMQLVPHLAQYLFEEGSPHKPKIERQMKDESAMIIWPANGNDDKMIKIRPVPQRGISVEWRQWKDRVSQTLEDIFDKFLVDELAVSSPCWNEVCKKIDSSDYGQINPMFSIEQKTILLRGPSDLVKRCKAELQAAEKELEKQRIKKVLKISPEKFKLFFLCQIKDNLSQKWQNIVISADSKWNEITIEGLKADVAEVHTDIYARFDSLKHLKIRVSPSKVEFISHTEDKIHEVFSSRNINAACQITRQEFEVVGGSKQDIKRAIAFIKDELSDDSIPFQDVEIFQSPKGLALLDDINQGKLVLATVNQEGGCVDISGFKSDVEKESTKIRVFIDKNAVVQLFIPLQRGKLRYLDEHAVEELRSIGQNQNPAAEIRIELRGSKRGIKVSGVEQALQNVLPQITNLAEGILERQHPITKPGKQEILGQSNGKIFLDRVQKDCQCIIESTDNNDVDEHTDYQEGPPRMKSRVLLSHTTPSGCQLKICHGDLTTERVDAIVNADAANTDLRHVGGLAKAIVDQGGSSIQRESEDILRRLGRSLFTAESVVTGPGNLPCRHIIHVAGPRWPTRKRYSGSSGIKTQEEDLLYDATKNVLREASRRKISSISLPAISSGIYGFPDQLCAQTMLDAVLDFCNAKKSSSIKEVRFTNNNQKATDAFLNEFQNRFGKQQQERLDHLLSAVSGSSSSGHGESREKPSDDTVILNMYARSSRRIDQAINKIEDFIRTEFYSEDVTIAPSLFEELTDPVKIQYLYTIGEKNKVKVTPMLDCRAKRISIQGKDTNVRSAIYKIHEIFMELQTRRAEDQLINKEVRWKYKDATGIFVEYGDEINPIIERAHREERPYVIVPLEDGGILIDFETMTETPQGSVGAKAIDVNRCECDLKNENSVQRPQTRMNPGVNNATSVLKSEREHGQVATLFQSVIGRQGTISEDVTIAPSLVEELKDPVKIQFLYAIGEKNKVKVTPMLDCRAKRISIQGKDTNVRSAIYKIHEIFMELQTRRAEDQLINKEVRWKYKDATGIFVEYGDEINPIIERAHREERPYVIVPLEDGGILIDFETMTETPQGSVGAKAVDVNRCECDLKNENSVQRPQTRMNPGVNNATSVLKSEREHGQVATLFQSVIGRQVTISEDVTIAPSLVEELKDPVKIQFLYAIGEKNKVKVTPMLDCRAKRISIQGKDTNVRSAIYKIQEIFMELQTRRAEDQLINKEVRWKYKDATGIFVEYGDEINPIIERAHREERPYVIVPLEDGGILIDFETMTETPQGSVGAKAVDVNRCECDLKNENSVQRPQTRMNPGVNNATSVLKSEREHGQVATLFQSVIGRQGTISEDVTIAPSLVEKLKDPVKIQFLYAIGEKNKVKVTPMLDCRAKRISIQGKDINVRRAIYQIQENLMELQREQTRRAEDQLINKLVQWKYKNATGIFVEYGDEINPIIERAHREERPYVMLSLKDGGILIDFETMTETPQGSAGAKAVDVNRCDL